MPENITEGVSIEAPFEFGEFVLGVCLERLQIFGKVFDSQVFGRAVHKVVTHIIGLPELVPLVDPLVQKVAEQLVTVVAGMFRG